MTSYISGVATGNVREVDVEDTHFIVFESEEVAVPVFVTYSTSVLISRIARLDPHKLTLLWVYISISNSPSLTSSNNDFGNTRVFSEFES